MCRHRHFLWLLARGMTATAVASLTGYSAYWVGQIARRYKRDGPDGVRERRHNSRAHGHSLVLLTEGEQADLRAEIVRVHPDLTRCTILFSWWPARITWSTLWTR